MQIIEILKTSLDFSNDLIIIKGHYWGEGEAMVVHS